MKKKIIFISMLALFFLGIAFFKPRKIFASCFIMSGTTTPCTAGHHWCSPGSTVDPAFDFSSTRYCCDTVAECQQIIQGNTTVTNNLVGQTDPRCPNNSNGIDTAVGCIPFTNTNDFTGRIFKWALGIGGGIAFLLIVYGGFLVMTSTGNPDRLEEGKGVITAAISGLILLIFSVFILKFLGVNILGLPGFS